ncbi:MAG: signal peptide peptidase SppA, partial [Phycisphaerales bacterium]|nr:signal peptide peptidase SppA [Phycisphaerales bacterium]
MSRSRLASFPASPFRLSLIAGLALASGVFVLPVRADTKPHKAAAAEKEAKDTEKASTGIGLIEIHGTPSEEPKPLAWLLGSDDHPTLRQIIDLFKDAQEDKDLKAFVVRLRDATLSRTQAEEIGQAMQRLRDTGKKVHLFADNYEATELVLGSYADEIIIQAGGGVSLPGMHMEEMFLADTMAWAGVVPQMVQVGDYKGANEQYMRSAPSPAWDQNINSLLDALYGNMRDRLKAGRKMDDSKLDEAMRQNWMALAETGRKTGLIDAVVDLPALTEHLEAAYKTDISWSNYEVESTKGKLDGNPLTIFSKLMSQPSNTPTREAIAIVHVNGPIVDGESESGGFMSGASVGSATIRRALEEILEEDLVKGVIVRIDSPGGSAIASEVMWQGVQRVRKDKPVWVSVGSMAASGGYYTAVAAEKIYVNPSSIVGSIGVVGGKIAMGGLYDKAKVHITERSRGPLGDMFSSTKPWTDQQQQMVRDKMTETYTLFTSRVSAGRSGIELAKTAEGRLFTGEQAVKNRMADKVGSLDDCLTDLASTLKLEDGEYQIIEYPGPKALGEVLG